MDQTATVITLLGAQMMVMTISSKTVVYSLVWAEQVLIFIIMLN